MPARPGGLMAKQADFVYDRISRELLYSGAFGAGKTRALCYRAVALAQHPLARVAIVRKTLTDLKATTLVTLLQQDGDLPAVLPPGTYTHHKVDCWIKLNGGGTILYFGCDDPQKVGSRSLTDVLIDEGIELEESEYVMLLGRCRVRYTTPTGKQNTRSICTATNPGSPAHFLYKRFYENRHDDRRIIETSTAENYFLPEDYRKSLAELTGIARQRYYEGKWVAFEGAIYWMFDPKLHVRHDPGPWDFYVTGLDWGFRNPSVLRVHGCKLGSKKSHVVAEYYQSKTTSDELVQLCRICAETYGPNTFVVDPSAADLKAQMVRADLTVVDAENDVLQGIRCVESSLSLGETGMPTLTMEASCRDGNREYPLYRWADSSTFEKPIKEFDHALDADRYARMYVVRRAGGLTGLVTFGTPPAPKERADEGLVALRLGSEWPDGDPLNPRLWPRSAWQ